MKTLMNRANISAYWISQAVSVLFGIKGEICSDKNIFRYCHFFVLGAFLVFFLLNLMLRLVIGLETGVPFNYPFSIMFLRVPFFLEQPIRNQFDIGASPKFYILELFDMIMIPLNIAFFLLIYKYLDRFRTPLSIFFLGIGLIFLLNLIQGVDGGLVQPLIENGYSYYYDAEKLDSITDFFINYNNIQLDLNRHSRTHPPGAVIFHHILYVIFRERALMNIAMMLLSLPIVFYIFNFVKYRFSEDVARKSAIIFIFLPAVTIYYLSSIDSIICLAFLGFFYHFYFYTELESRKKFIHLAIAVIWLTISLMLTYIAPMVLVITSTYLVSKFIEKRNYGDFVKKNILIYSMLVLILILFYLCGFNFIQGFIQTSRFENSTGHMLFHNTVRYFFTRIECVSDLLIFFSPILSFILFCQFFKKTKKNLFPILAGLALLLLFITGAYRTGETARGCFFIYPFFLLGICSFLENKTDERIFKKIVLFLWVQGLLLQTIAYFQW